MPQEEDGGGDLRRPYAVRPSIDKRARYAADDPFAFTVTLFGEHLGYLPYLALGAEGMGAGGIGRKEIQRTDQQREHWKWALRRTPES